MEQVSIVSPDDDAASISSLYDIPPHLLAKCEAGWGTLKFQDILSQVCSDVSYSPYF
jgi:hypothetical protein